MDEGEIRDHAIALRDAFEAFRRVSPDDSLLAMFPSAGCTISTIALAIHFHEHCGLDKSRISSRWNGRTTDDRVHAWLMINDHLCADISADQFPEISERVLVQPLSRWHYKFEDFSTHDYKDTISMSSGWKQEYVYPVFRMLPSHYKTTFDL